MRKFVVDESQDNKKIVRVLTGEFPEIPLGAVYKTLRNKDVKINGVRIKEDIFVKKGDFIEIYIDERILVTDTPIDIVYEDENIIIVNKPQGLKVHPDKESNTGSLIELLEEKYGKNVYLCHRIDRNTGGLLIVSKKQDLTGLVSEKIKNSEIVKIYRCRVHGQIKDKHKEFVAYHQKNSKESLVYISDEMKPKSSKIITICDLLRYDRKTDTSIVDITLITGKTHQIRAHMAHIGHPIVGDGKYGNNEAKKRLGEKHKYQELYAYKLIFDFSTHAGKLDYLKGTTVQINIPI